MRLIWLFIALALIFLVPFLIWGGRFAEWLSAEGAEDWLRGYGAWAWAAGIVLLTLDLFLPIPGTIFMSALGLVYGTWLGGLIAATGSILSALLAFGICRRLGHGAALRLVGERGLADGQRLFAHAGGWLVVLSRWLPLMPEVVSCMAGLMHMRRRVFVVAVLCGSLPLAFVFAWIGATGRESPGLAIALSLGIPVLLWLAVRLLMPQLLRRRPL